MSWLYQCLEAKDLAGYDFVVMRGKVPLKAIQCISPVPSVRAQMLRELALDVQRGDTLVLGGGEWNLGMAYWQLPALTIVGRGQDVTRLVNNQEDQANWCGFEFTRGTSLENLTLTWKPRDAQVRGGQTVGIASRTAPPAIISKMTNVDVYGYGSAAMYFWGASKQHKVMCTNCRFFAGRWSVSIGAGSADDVVSLELNSCEIYCDFSKYGGAGGDMGTPGNTTGLLLRGGNCHMLGGIIRVKGFPGTGVPNDPNGPPFELAIGAATSSLGSPLWPNLPVYGNGVWPYLLCDSVDIKVDQNGAKQAIDLWGQIGKIDYIGGHGSNADGTYNKQGNVVEVG